jgi:membrane associated rhomboid family serine protease
MTRLPATSAFVAVCIATFACSQSATIAHAQQTWRSLTPSSVATPAFWLLLLPSAVFHSGPWHLITNTLAFIPLAAFNETRAGFARTSAFIVICAAIASAAQLLIGGHGDVGSSGVVFGMLGWALISPRRTPALSAFAVALLAWFVYCFFANAFFGAHYGNASHTAGLLFGVLTSFIEYQSSRRGSI